MKRILVILLAATLCVACNNKQKQEPAPKAGEEALDVTTPQTPEEIEASLAEYVPKLDLGSPAYDFKLDDIDGGQVNLSDYMGSYVVVDFWASWCPDCVKEIPAFKAMVAEYKPLGIEFVSVSLDTDAEKWRDCVDANDMDWTHVSNLIKWKENPVTQEYDIRCIPTIVLVDPNGEIVATRFTVAKMSELLKDLV